MLAGGPVRGVRRLSSSGASEPSPTLQKFKGSIPRMQNSMVIAPYSAATATFMLPHAWCMGCRPGFVAQHAGIQHRLACSVPAVVYESELRIFTPSYGAGLTVCSIRLHLPSSSFVAPLVVKHHLRLRKLVASHPPSLVRGTSRTCRKYVMDRYPPATTKKATTVSMAMPKGRLVVTMAGSTLAKPLLLVHNAKRAKRTAGTKHKAQQNAGGPSCYL